MALTRLTSLAPRGGCALWLIALDAPLCPGDTAMLAPDERQRADRFVFAVDRQRFIAARSALREVLGRAVGSDPSRIGFDYGAAGKPQLRGAMHLPFNLSHSGPVGLLAVATDGPDAVGVDIELLRDVPDAMQLAQSTFDPHECAELGAIDVARRPAGFLAGWTRREAGLKAAGTGFSATHTPPPTGFAMGRSTVRWPGALQARGTFATIETFALPEVNAVASVARLRAAPDEPATALARRTAMQELA